MAYSPGVLDHFHNPRNVGELDDPDAVGASGEPGQGNYMVIHLSISDGRIAEARFRTYGCPGAIACGSMATELAKGRTLAEARAISPDGVLGCLGGLPLGKRHCAELAASALRKALDAAAGRSRNGAN